LALPSDAAFWALKASLVDMTDYALGYSGASAAGALLSFLLTLSGFLVPWWTATEPAELAPIVTEVSLWTSNTRWTLRKDGGVDAHTGCDYRCNQARFTRPIVYSKCQAWEEMRSWAPTLCDLGFESRAESLVTTTTAEPILFNVAGLPQSEYDQNNYNFNSEGQSQNVYVNPDSAIDKQGPPLPPNTLQISTYKPFEFGQPTTTITSRFTRTATTVTTTPPLDGQTIELTPIPVATTPMLGAAHCDQPTWEERATAPYTEWEINFNLDQEIMDRIFVQLYPFFSKMPHYFFTQRPLNNEHVRLVWEAYVKRSPDLKWLGAYPCPSVPARELHAWIWNPTSDPDVVSLGEQGLMPRNIAPVEWSDWALKEAWELEILDITTTVAPTVGGLAALTSSSLAPAAPEMEPPPTQPPEPEAYEADVTSFVRCHLAEYEPQNNADTPFTWYEKENPCGVAGNLEKVWVVKGSLVLALLLSMAHSFPAAVLFLGSKQRFSWRFPAGVGMYMAIGVLVLQLISVITASTMVLNPEMNGPGFFCTIFAMLCSVFAAVTAKFSQIALAAQEPEAPTTASVAVGRIQVDPWSLQTAAQVAWDAPPKAPSTRQIRPQP